MNFPRYEFCRENKSLLASFIKKANENKSNTFCNLQKYYEIAEFLPGDSSNSSKQCRENEVNDIITISDEELFEVEQMEIKSQRQMDSVLDEMLEQSSKNINETSEDITYAIKENLETENTLSSTMIANLHRTNLDLDSIFLDLSKKLSFEEVINFGLSLISAVVNDDFIISCYIRHLLINKLTMEFSVQLQSSLNDFCKRYSDILKDEIAIFLVNATEDYTKVFLQYLDGFAAEFKSNLFKNFIFGCKDLQDHHIGLIDVLLNNQVESNSLNKLVEIMSLSANKYSSEKSFGKLLMNVIKLLGKNVSTLEKPLNHIIGSHRSVWKSKIQKMFDENYRDSSMLSQSLRY